MTTYRSSQLGWKNGQDVSSQLKTLVEKSLADGDSLVLDGTYRVGGANLRLPDDFTLSSKTGGGFTVTDGATNQNPLLLLGDGNTLSGVTFGHVALPDGNHKRTISVNQKSDVLIENSRFEGNANIFIDFGAGRGNEIRNTEFDGGVYQVRLLGDVRDMLIDSSLFANSRGDGIKTLRGDGLGAQQITVSNSVFENNARDGIDTTGGFKNSTVTGSIFRDNGVSGMDIKTIIESGKDLSSDQMNANILVKDSEFINNPWSIVFTTNDRDGLLSRSEARQWSVQNVRIEDSIVERNAEFDRPGVNVGTFLIKDAHDITWSNLQVLGKVHEFSSGGNFVNPNDLGLGYNVGGDETHGPARPPSTDYPFVAGPEAADAAPAPEPGGADAVTAPDASNGGSTDGAGTSGTATDLELARISASLDRGDHAAVAKDLGLKIMTGRGDGGDGLILADPDHRFNAAVAKGGDNVLAGDGRDNWLVDGSGDNLMHGGGGADDFRFSAADFGKGGADTVLDMDFGEGDRLVLKMDAGSFAGSTDGANVFSKGSGAIVTSAEGLAGLAAASSDVALDAEGDALVISLDHGDVTHEIRLAGLADILG